MMGVVRNADTDVPLVGALVVVMWTEMNIGTSSLSKLPKAAHTTVGPRGDYRLCGLPNGVALRAQARLGTKASGWIDVTMPPGGVIAARLPRGRASGCRGARGIATRWANGGAQAAGHGATQRHGGRRGWEAARGCASVSRGNRSWRARGFARQLSPERIARGHADGGGAAAFVLAQALHGGSLAGAREPAHRRDGCEGAGARRRDRRGQGRRATFPDSTSARSGGWARSSTGTRSRAGSRC